MNKVKLTLLTISAALSASVLYMHGLLGSYTRFIADDFCSAYYAEHFGLLRSIWYWRLNWSGRYTAFAADWFLTKVVGIDNLSFVLPILLAAWLLFASIAIYRFLRSDLTKLQDQFLSVFLGITFLFVLFGLTPNIPQSFYWWNGMRSYTLPLIFLTAYLDLYLFFPKQAQAIKTQIAIFILFFLLLFTSGGMGETAVIFQFSLLLFLIIMRWLPKFQLNWDTQLLVLISSLFGSVASLVIIITAPGNAVRQELMSPTTNIFHLLEISWDGFWIFITGILNSPEKITLSIGSFLLSIWIGNYYHERSNIKKWMIPACVAGGIILSFACFVPGAYGYSEPPPTRVLIFASYALSITVMLSGFMIGTHLNNIFSSTIWRLELVFVISVLLLGYSATIQVGSLYDLKKQYISFADSWDKMDAQIRLAKNDHEESITLPFVNNWATLNTLTDNPKFWVNVCYSNYYGISVIGEFPFDFKKYENVENEK